LADRQTQVAELSARVRQWQTGLAALKASVEGALAKLHAQHAAQSLSNGRRQSSDGHQRDDEVIVSLLTNRRSSHPSEDYPLPELYREACRSGSQPTIGQFHDVLRRLHERERIYLHPWTGPLYEIPEPSFALLIGHEVVYYVSLR